MSNQPPIRPLLKGMPKIIGLYGLPGSGKSFLKHHLEQQLLDAPFLFFEGSDIINKITDGGLEQFKSLPELEKKVHREKAITWIRDQCAQSNKIGIVTGHFMFWSEGNECPEPVLTNVDWKSYTHIVYLNLPPVRIAKQIKADATRDRGEELSVSHLKCWQQMELKQLRGLCLQHEVLFSIVFGNQQDMPTKIQDLIYDFSEHDEETNKCRALQKLDTDIAGDVQTMMVIDGDKTLAAEDTGDLFWDEFTNVESLERDLLCHNGFSSLATIFQSNMKYSYNAFRQAALMYELSGTKSAFESFCGRVVDRVSIRSEFKALLDRIAADRLLGAVIVTCGLAYIWELALERANVEGVTVIGSGRITNGFVVTPNVKAAVVSRLQHTYHMEVFAFGDSPLDLAMLRLADRAFVAVGTLESRSRSMEKELLAAIESGLKAEQLLLPDTVPHRLHPKILPISGLQNLELRPPMAWKVDLAHATDRTSAKLLASSSRNADCHGPALRTVHMLIGQYLATEFVADKVGLETYPIRHVSGGYTEGHRLMGENKTLIVPLMRGGEPMAFGVGEAFPLAAFHHSKDCQDIEAKHLRGMSTVILVDSVINTGASIVKAINYIRNICKSVQIVVVAGVVQVEAVGESGIGKQLDGYGRVTVIALRLSKNKYKGTGGTDTGHRLFNTTYLG